MGNMAPQVRAVGGGPPVIRMMPEHSGTQSFVRGAWVEKDGTSEKIKEASSNTCDIAGMALKAASGTEDTLVPVAIAEGNEFLVSILGSGHGNVLPGDRIEIDASSCASGSSCVGVLSTENADGQLAVTELDRRDTTDSPTGSAATSGARVWCRIISLADQLDAVSQPS